MSFNMFLDRMQKMFNILNDKRTQMANSTQVRDLFSRVQHQQLQDTAKDHEVRAYLDGIIYSEAANYLTVAVSNIPEYQFSRRVSFIQVSGGNSLGGVPIKGVCNSGSIYNSQWKTNTGYCYNWKGISKEYCKTVIAAHKIEGNKSNQTASNKEVV